MKMPKFLSVITLVVGATIIVPTTQVLAAPKQLTYSPAYVAFGDSLTTGSSVATCVDNRKQSPWGCTELPRATPYPDRIARALHMSYGDIAKNYANQTFDMYRSGIWGYTLQEAAKAEKAGNNAEGGWVPQLTAIKQAQQLVTGSLGINDMRFSDVGRWVRLFIRPGGDFITPAAQKLVADRSADFDRLFDALESARSNGAKVVLGLYYNPYDSAVQQCSQLESIGERIVNALDDELLNRAHAAGLSVVDFRSFFAGHGAGSDDPYVFGTACSLDVGGRTWLESVLKGRNAKRAIAIKFDPHPNSAGTEVMANIILQEFNNAD